jgi:steroid delta-isomerase-like uncharacterized protein
MQTVPEAIALMFSAVETGDVSNVSDYIANDYLNHESVDDGRSNKLGPEEFKESVEWLRASFSDLHFDIKDVIVANDQVVVVAVMQGRQTAQFMELPATNRSFRQRQVHLFRLNDDGKVADHLAQRDDLGLRRQLAQ